MDVNKALRELYEEKKRLDAAIAALESRLGSSRLKRRGRRSMSQEERLEVSRRMSRYWEARRAQGRALDAQSNAAAAASSANEAS